MYCELHTDKAVQTVNSCNLSTLSKAELSEEKGTDDVTVEQFGDVGVSVDRGRRSFDVSRTGNTG